MSHSGYVTPVLAMPSANCSGTSSLDVDASDDTAYAPRFAEFVRCVGVSAPGGPPPLPVLRADDSIFFSQLPMKPPPPTGLVNRSGSSESSVSPSSSSSSSVPARRFFAGHAGGSPRPVSWPSGRDAASTFAARITPNPGAGSSTAARPAAMLSEAAGESLRLAMSRSPIDAKTLGSRSPLLTSAR